MCEIGNTPHVRIESATLRDVIELNSTIELEETRKPEDWNRVAVPELYELEWHQREHVEKEFFRFHIIER